MPATWVFQENPKTYRVDEAISQLSEIIWLLAQHRHAIHTDDVAYIWKCGPAASLLCRSTVMCEPALLDDNPKESRFYVDEGKFRGAHLRVRIRIDEVLPRPVSRNDLLANLVLAVQRIFTGWQGTNFPLTDLAPLQS